MNGTYKYKRKVSLDGGKILPRQTPSVIILFSYPTLAYDQDLLKNMPSTKQL
jgi:hypothetical protein